MTIGTTKEPWLVDDVVGLQSRREEIRRQIDALAFSDQGLIWDIGSRLERLHQLSEEAHANALERMGYTAGRDRAYRQVAREMTKPQLANADMREIMELLVGIAEGQNDHRE